MKSQTKMEKTGEDYAIVAIAASNNHLNESLCTLCNRLLFHHVKIVTTTTLGHEILTNNGIHHLHLFHRPDDVVISKALIVICGGLNLVKVDVKNDELTGIFSLLRVSALDYQRVVCLCDPVHYSLAYNPSKADLETRKRLAAFALRYLSTIDFALATSLQIPSCVPANKKNNVVLVVGNGGREHALAVKLSESPLVKHVFVAPGNAGTATCSPKISNLEGVYVDDIPALVRAAKEKNVALTCVGPEQPLVDGLSDALNSEGIPCFGPGKLAARLEGSKAFAKDFMIRHDIPTARYRTFTNVLDAKAHVISIDYPIVIKASNLAAGKGVVLPDSKEEALQVLQSMMVDGAFGTAGEEVVIEERLEGEEASVLAFCDGYSCCLMPACQDHKRVFDDDEGPNTGGMGCYAPAPIVGWSLQSRIALNIVQKVLDGCREEGYPFVGVLYCGLMITSSGPQVLEFNARFGDPETQVILPLLESDLFEVMMNCVNGSILTKNVAWAEAHCATVVLTSKGYPGKYEKDVEVVVNKPIDSKKIQVYHAGTRVDKITNKVVTSGGRVLAVSARRPKLAEALTDVYNVINEKQIDFAGAHFRTDIGRKGLRDPIRLGILGSTRGTDLQYLIDAVDEGFLRADIKVVVSNKKSAYILTRAREQGLKAVALSAVGLGRTDFDAKVTQALKDHDVELVLLIGYMRIVSDEFVDEWAGRCLNVHPSLLPEFAGGMDANVHAEVLAAKKKETGCTVHLVTKEVDGGPIIVQKRCPVFENDDVDTLKARVQALEGKAFVEAINLFVHDKFPSS